MPKPHRRVLQLLADCKTGRLGAACYRCARCETSGKPAVHFTNASCGNRHCPGCQTSANGDWCVAQTKKLLPCEYHFVTFTVPSELRPFIRSNQSLCYNAMFRAAAFALRTVMANPKFCGATNIGFTSVLHTFGRDLTYHPHVHVILPAGGRNDDGEWKSTLPKFLAPVKLLSKLFRMEFERLVRSIWLSKGDATNGSGSAERRSTPADSSRHRPPVLPAFRREFVCDVEPVGDGAGTLKYLSRYVSRTAITNDRIVAMNGGRVTFRYRKTGEHRDRLMTVSAMEFLRRFLQHVLPRGLQRVRHYGFLSRRSKVDLDDLRAIILQSMADSEPDLELVDWTVPVVQSSRGESSGPRCPTCGSELTFESFIRIRPPPLEWRV